MHSTQTLQPLTKRIKTESIYKSYENDNLKGLGSMGEKAQEL
jgi:hypothetical protein